MALKRVNEREPWNKRALAGVKAKRVNCSKQQKRSYMFMVRETPWSRKSVTSSFLYERGADFKMEILARAQDQNKENFCNKTRNPIQKLYSRFSHRQSS